MRKIGNMFAAKYVEPRRFYKDLETMYLTMTGGGGGALASGGGPGGALVVDVAGRGPPPSFQKPLNPSVSSFTANLKENKTRNNFAYLPQLSLNSSALSFTTNKKRAFASVKLYASSKYVVVVV